MEVCRRLAELYPGSGEYKSVLLNSGAEAVENAVKIARAATGRPAVIAFDRAFHGRTLLTMSLTSKVTPYKRGFGPFAPEVYRAPAPYEYRGITSDDAIEGLERLFKSDVDPQSVACVVLEPVQGEGGFVPMPADFPRRLHELCKAHGILYVDDEVQAGVGRTGPVWAIEHYGVTTSRTGSTRSRPRCARRWASYSPRGYTSCMADEAPELQKSLKSRHMTMISLGGVIGAGLFVGSSAVINTTGPAAVLSYLAAGFLIVLVMRMLGEMAVANPQVGSFAEYARRSLGGWAGFSVGWLYWYFWAIVLAIEAVAGAEILQRWIDAPVWIMALVLMGLLTGVNLASVKSFGEFEFWFAGIKVVAIVAFILIAAGFLFGIGAGDSPGLSNLTSHEGFAPAGIVTVLSGVVIVIFAFVGAEIVTIAAAESAEPEENVTKAVNTVVLRILTFYVAAIFLIVCILPWSDAKPGESPFIAALEKIGIPGAADVMNAVVVTAVLSCLNSGMYTGSRMLFALARRGDAPKGLLEVNGRGVPVKAILLTSSIGFASTALAYLSPDTVFLFLVNSSGAIALFVYVLIACSQLKMRRRLEREAPERLKVKMWAFPYLTYFAIAAMVTVIGSMALVKDVRAQLIPSFISLAIVLAAYWFKTRAERRTATVPAGAT